MRWFSEPMPERAIGQVPARNASSVAPQTDLSGCREDTQQDKAEHRVHQKSSPLFDAGPVFWFEFGAGGSTDFAAPGGGGGVFLGSENEIA